MSSNKKYWKSVEELKEDSSIVERLQKNEFAEDIPTDEFLGDKETLENSSTSRRDFLKYIGFSTAAASLAACEGPVMKSIPYVVQPERIVPGVADYYATTIADGFDFASILVKTREARPIKVDKNYLGENSRGVNARVHASVLDLYDNNRIKRPKANGETVSWEELDRRIEKGLKEVSGETVLLTQTFASPSTTKLIKEFSEKHGNVRHVVYDAVSEDPSLNAFQARYGKRALPAYDFSQAEVIISVGADFLGDWNAGGYDVGYAQSRIPTNGKMSRHVQFESNMTTTGAKADNRIAVTPTEQKRILSALYSYLVEGSSANSGLTAKVDDAVVKAARQLRKAGSGGVVVSGIPETDAQLLVLAINEALGSRVMNTEEPLLIRQGDTSAVTRLIEDMNAGTIGAIMIAGVNPVYSLPQATEFIEGLKKVELSVAFTQREDETAKLCDFVAAVPHYLESWGDVQYTPTKYSLMQPTIRPLFDTRQFQECLLKWSGNSTSYYDYIKDLYSSGLSNFSWVDALHDGIFKKSEPVIAQEVSADQTLDVDSGHSAAARRFAQVAEKDDNTFELVLNTKISMGDGHHANNPWLQELPDPITRTTWDNYITMSMADADALGVENETVSNGALNGDYVRVIMDDVVLESVPVLIQPGQARGTIGLALGYGRRDGIQKEMQVGVNAYPLYRDFKSFQNVKIEKIGGEHEFACTQLQATLAGRDSIIQETNLETYNTKPQEVWNSIPKVSYNHQEVSVHSDNADIWERFDRSTGHYFKMSIDLNACTACGACVIACHSENNVPVVGKEEVRNFRDMHWLRIDRYYSSAETFAEGQENLKNLGTFETFDIVENPDDNPQVAFQPVMCQHCNQAPCETVCPVAATMHGRQGQNMMIYNRCVGTRYCANNCPYKVRRFNWFRYNKNEEFAYHMDNDLGRMVLNPDVVVRSRGVMEKCTFCIQLTQKVILDAKQAGKPVEDGEFYTACSRACDKGAIVFGDVNIEDSLISKKRADKRMYHLLASTGTDPNVMYQVKVNNTAEV